MVQRLAEDLLGQAARVDVGGVDQVHAGVYAEVEQAGRTLGVRVADLAERAGAAERHGAERESGDEQAGAAELSVLHARAPLVGEVRRKLALCKPLGKGEACTVAMT